MLYVPHIYKRDEADFHEVKLKKNDITYHLKLQKIIRSLNEN